MAASPGSGGSLALSGSNNDNTQNLLSFISLALEEFHSFDLGFTLLSVVLTEDTFHQRSTAAEGGSIRIVICEYDALLEARRLRQDQMHIIPQTSSSPETVALKIPVLRAPYSSDRNRELWTLMAKELRILRHSSIASHPNIVNLLGVSWTAANLDPSLLLPVLVLEATQLGDMREFCREGRRLYPRKWLGLGVDVTSGLAALHDAGVFHGDLKPENVLIFEGPDLAYTAKLADFGSAIFLADMRAPVRTTFATQFWAAPETSESLTGDQLLKADIYSLGLLLWDMLPGGAIQYGNTLIRLGALPSISGTIEEMKASGEPLGSIASRLLRLYWNGIYDMSQDDSSEDSDDGSDQSKESLGVIGRRIGALIGAAVRDTLEDPAERTASARQVLEELTNALHFACKGDLLHAIHNLGLQPLPVFDSREHEALLHPPWNQESRVASGEGSSSQAGENSTVLRNVASQGPNDNQGTADQQRSTLNTPFWQRQPASASGRITFSDWQGVLDTQYIYTRLRLLPCRVLGQLLQQLQTTVNSADMSSTRRARAAYEFGVLSLCLLQVSPQTEAKLEKALHMLAKAAELGQIEALGIVGWLYEAFGKALPVSLAETEMELLSEPFFMGTRSTARRRLRHLGWTRPMETSDLGYYPGVIHRVRSTAHSQLPLDIFVTHRITPHSHVRKLLWSAVCNGQDRLLHRLTRNSLPEINLVDKNGDSALLMASRRGNSQAMLQLLNAGADAYLANHQGVTALHHLSAFSDESIPTVARALVDGGASLEARARGRATTFNDPIFPMLGGAPLVWAVAADSPIAVSTLIDLGADPFDEAAQAAPTSDRWTEFNHLSPVVVAAARHQHEIIRALFPPERRAATPNLGNRLNNVRIRMGSQGALTSFSLFSICARYDIEGLLPRVLLHGRDHKIAFKCTFELLIDLGADPLDTQHDGAVIIGCAVHAGQPFVLDYLMQWRGGILHNDRPRVWYEMMCGAARDEDRVIFDTLLKYEIADQISVEEWGEYLALMARETNDPYFLDPFADKIRAAGDLGPHLSVALDAGNFETARWIYGVAASCDLVQPVEGLSLLGRILLKSRRFFTLHSAVSAVLALPGVPERVFDNAMELGGSQLTVLHVAALHLEYHPDSTMATRVFEEVADVFYEPEQLNAQPASGAYEGYSPLHFAIEYGNAGAARRLLREVDSGLNPNVVNGRGETAVDVLLRQFTSQERRFDMFDVPTQRRGQLGIRHWEHTLEVLAALRNAGGHHRKYVQAVLRPSEDLLFIYDLRRNQPFLEVTYRPDAIPRELVERDPFFQSVSRLRVLDCFLVGDPRYWPADEVRGRVLPPPLLPTEDGPDLEPEEINARFLGLFDALRMRERGEREDQGAG